MTMIEHPGEMAFKYPIMVMIFGRREGITGMVERCGRCAACKNTIKHKDDVKNSFEWQTELKLRCA